MLRRIASLLLALLLFLPWGAACAEERLSDLITTEVFLEGEWQPLTQHMLYAHEGGVLADGALVFVPLQVYLQMHPAPAISLAEEPRFRVCMDPSVSRCTVTRQLYAVSGQELLRLEMPEHPLVQLPEGAYLLAIRWNAEGPGGSASYQAMLWLLSGDAQIPDLSSPAAP